MSNAIPYFQEKDKHPEVQGAIIITKIIKGIGDKCGGRVEKVALFVLLINILEVILGATGNFFFPGR